MVWLVLHRVEARALQLRECLALPFLVSHPPARLHNPFPSWPPASWSRGLVQGFRGAGAPHGLAPQVHAGQLHVAEARKPWPN
eukprot:1142675-Pelagomonas_calceolata.AAC.4